MVENLMFLFFKHRNEIPIHAIHRHVERTLNVIMAYVPVCPNIMEILTLAVDRNACWALIARQIKHAYNLNASILVKICVD